MEQPQHKHAQTHPAASRGEKVPTEATYSGQREDTTTYFSGKTEMYQRHRPGYPHAAIEAVLLGLGREPIVADVGCGTGISSRALAAAGARVIGVEPNDAMLRAARTIPQAAGEHPIEYRPGTGEATGLDHQSVDCVVCAQAFHWFNRERALREFNRVLRRGGRLALLWNKRDESDPASAGYEKIIRSAMDIAEESGRVVARFRSAPTLSPWFEIVNVQRFDNPAEYSLDDLLGRARSSSYWPEDGPARIELERELESLFRSHQTDEMLHLRQFTEFTLARAAHHSAVADSRG